MKHPGKILSLAVLLALAVPTANAQGRKSLRINEVMVSNQSSIVDDYGNRSAWIELLNPTAAAVDISSIYFTDDPANPTKYYVPRGDAETKIGKGQQVLFWADGKANNGTFHLNFTLTPGQDNFIAIYDADGINLIDSVTIPASLAPGCSYARTPDGGDSWQPRDNSSEAAAITPGGRNVIKGPNNKIETFSKMDNHGFAMAAMAMSIVFGALLVLCICFILIRTLSRNNAKAAAPAPAPIPADNNNDDGAIAAAIAMALNQYLNAGTGNSRLTIRHNPASAWCTKIMRETPRR